MAFDINTLLSAQLHDLKNQMQSLFGAQSELEEALELNPEQQTLLNNLQNHSNALSLRLVELLSVLKLQNQSFQPNIDEGWLMDTLSPIAHEFHELHGMVISLDFDEDFNQFYDEQLLTIAAHNACLNAYQAGANTIAFTVIEHEKGRWQLDITDNGPGFDNDLLNDKNTFSPSGVQNGLGLYLIDQALKAHKRNNLTGKVEIRNNLNCGAQISLIFP
ncbi:hypothetical protein NBRC116188_28760 [Oceaniserpentilla sp. 4NH20-0058]|uniref:sensor histidine kinase n=1 Tax=Oceaniserpentilla sp. 4NH20-0058 TaxID=3127660 RepID=UPI003102E677